MRWPALKYSCVVLLPVLLASCGSLVPAFSWGSSKAKLEQAPPEYTEDQRKALQQSVDVADQVAGIALTTGIGRASQESLTLKAQTENIKLVVGQTTDPIAWNDKKKIEELTLKMRQLEEDRRLENALWKAQVNALASNNEELKKEKSSLVSWLIWAAVAIGILVFLFPTVGIPLVMWFLKRTAKVAATAAEEATDLVKGQVKQVVLAVEDYKKKVKETHPELHEELKTCLAKRTDENTRVLIGELKTRHA